eukprot:TRINITY_DN5476_c0_g1_i1.p1 TRINITY_DN5476_c0_g1~~TRINITY_DN5476_c0_g1_i1.p1  ORF type:complete len:439 (-),score=144.61 TRINITY_DN5476_c0_g1_i1:92-1408(-)
MDFLSKKSFHPARIQNQEKVWKAEQEKEAEQRKLMELQRKLQEERALNDLRQMQASVSKRKAPQERLAWMYEGGVGLAKEPVDTATEVSTPVNLADAQSHSGSSTQPQLGLFQAEAANAEQETWNRLREDPLLEMRRQETKSLDYIKNNPMKMATIRKQLEAMKKDEKQKKADKKRKRKEKKEEKRSKKKARQGDDRAEHHRDTDHRDHDHHRSKDGNREREGDREGDRHRDRDRDRRGHETEPERRRERVGGLQLPHGARRAEAEEEEEEHKNRSTEIAQSSKNRDWREIREEKRREKEAEWDKRDQERRTRDAERNQRRRAVASMTPEERERRLREMQTDGAANEEHRYRRVMDQRKQESDQDARDSAAVVSTGSTTKQRDVKNFLVDIKKQTYGSGTDGAGGGGGGSTLEDRMARNKHYRMRGHSLEEANTFARK